jgi:hypothetical protein
MAENDKILLDDMAIDAIKDDKFGFKEHAKRYARLVAGKNSPEYISVGISGSWGSGKSSMLNLVKCYLTNKEHYYELFHEELQENEAENKKVLEKEMPIVVQFDPWFFGSEEKIIESFFFRLAKVINKHNNRKINKSISKGLLCLSKAIKIGGNLIPMLNSIGDLTDELADVLLNSKENDDFFEIKHELQDNLNKLNKRVIILIDDMDRLQASETLTMLKIIRLVTDLPRINTIIAFDQNATANSISQKVGGDGYGYVKKMINVPTYLPKIQGQEKNVYLAKNYERIAATHCVILNRGIPISQRVNTEFAEKSIRTIRQAKNVLNMFEYIITILNKEVEFWDVLGICILFYYYSDVFDAFSFYQFPFGCDNNRKRVIVGKMTGKIKEKVVQEFNINPNDPIFRYLNQFTISKDKNGHEIMDEAKMQIPEHPNTIHSIQNHDKYFCLLRKWKNRIINLKVEDRLTLKDSVKIYKTNKQPNKAEA